jgi:hypothetical protein
MVALARPAAVCVLALCLATCAAPSVSFAQENVTVPKSRLEELERKEKELERLKGSQPTAPTEKPESPRPTAPLPSPPVLAPPPEPVVRYSSPALDSLQPLKQYEVVESMDLANYYYADNAAADRRFFKQKLAVRGEIVGFEKPLWKRSYRVLLKTPVHGTRVICDLLPPDKANAVFTTNHGDELVALMGETRVHMAKVGDNVVVKGECKGYNNSVVMIYAWDIKPAR